MAQRKTVTIRVDGDLDAVQVALFVLDLVFDLALEPDKVKMHSKRGSFGVLGYVDAKPTFPALSTVPKEVLHPTVPEQAAQQ
jgi:hypothetical protein